jgi:UDP-N-acetylmuramoyl-L-alanyl-D-glutamate--2,6-diaminopimelate ligase
MVKTGCQYALIEATSHAMTQSRLWGVNVDTAVLTNITKDHIEYHGSFHQYVEAKGQLFDMLRTVKRKPGIQKISILNLDSDEFSYFNQYISDRKVTYGLNAKADYYAKNIECSPGFSKFIFAMPNNHAEIRIAMPGRFNVYNAVAAGTVASAACGVPLEIIQKTLEKAQSFPGRMESIHAGQSFPVVVDYAHTPESIEEVCGIFRQLTKGRLFVVFGATGGGRDKSKRPVMGSVVEKYADCMLVTNDDPYDEDEYGIIEQVCDGVKRQEGDGLWKIIDRKEAIRTALHMASSNDAVLILGKGCEQVICLKEGKVPYDDREVVRNIIENEIFHA